MCLKGTYAISTCPSGLLVIIGPISFSFYLVLNDIRMESYSKGTTGSYRYGNLLYRPISL